MTRLALLACLVLAGCPKASAPKSPEPFDFKGDAPGVMSLVAFQNKYQLKKEPDSDPGEEKYVRKGDGLTLGSIPVESATYRFVDGELASIRVFLKEDPSGVLLGALKKAYGEPDPKKDERIRDVSWTRGGSELSMIPSQRPSVNYADLAIRRKLIDRNTKETEQKTDAAAKDL